jgi:uncharacterized protein DUF3237
VVVVIATSRPTVPTTSKTHTPGLAERAAGSRLRDRLIASSLNVEEFSVQNLIRQPFVKFPAVSAAVVLFLAMHGVAARTLWARIAPIFETASEKYAWLNNVLAVGVYRPDLGKIGYRVYRIL